MNTEKLAINWQNLIRGRLQLKFAFIIRALMLFLTLGPSSLPVLMTQSDERHANRTASNGMTDTEHSTTAIQTKRTSQIIRSIENGY